MSQRRRRGLAKLIARGQLAELASSTGAAVVAWVEARASELCDDEGVYRFDVARARELAHELIDLEVEHAVFTDWTLDRGLGPNNREPGAFTAHLSTVPVPDCCFGDGFWVADDGDGWVDAAGECTDCDGTGEVRGGWPGNLARKWATVPCETCKGERGRSSPRDASPGISLLADGLSTGYSATRQNAQGEHGDDANGVKWVWCPDCKGRGYQPKPGADRRAPMGKSLARQGRRLLDMLDGRGEYAHAEAQPSECQACADGSRWRCVYTQYSDDETKARDAALAYPGKTMVRRESPGSWSVDKLDCPDCQGTGHNLQGRLPPVEVPGERTATRACPRGQHLAPGEEKSDDTSV